ncbi:MAG: WYL domain-containing protein [Lachnospiraceae bacterium]|nr:WYL domain-containing protein [Lachnospiraceae bacterium]
MLDKFDQRLKLLYLMNIMLEKTDDEHGLKSTDIINLLSDYGIKVERKTLYSDIELLRKFGIDIYKEQCGKQTLYHVGSRDFELPELKLLVDLVQSSRFITKKKSQSLINKIEKLTSKYEAEQLQRQVFVSERVKSENERIYYNVDLIHTAINSDKSINFQYFQWNINKEKELRHNGKIYDVSPWALSWDSEKYYLVGYDEDLKAIRHYRVDKILNLKLSDRQRSGKNEFCKFDIAKYSKRIFGMFDGEEKRVKLRVKNSFVGVIIDRFGIDIEINIRDNEYFETEVEVVVSEQFLGWILALGDNVKIVEPEEVVKNMKDMLNERFKLYNDE